MTRSLSPLLRLAAAGLNRALCAAPLRIAVVVAIVAAVASSAHAAAPLSVQAPQAEHAPLGTGSS